MKTSTQFVREHRARKGVRPDPVQVKELIDKLLSDTEIHQGPQSVDIEWNFSPKQWQVVQVLATLQGVSADAWLEELGRKFINSRGAALQVSKGKAVLDVDDLEIGG